MKTYINNRVGIKTVRDENGIEIEGLEGLPCDCDPAEIFGDAWEDLYAQIIEGTGVSALTFEEYRDTGFFMRFFRYNQDDEIYMTYQMPHSWNVTTAVKPHMHYIPMGNVAGTALFNYKYAWANPGGEFPAASGWTSGTVSVSASSGDQFKHKIVGFGAVTPPPGASASSILVVKVSRPGSSDSNDTYNANVGILFFDAHYQKNRPGTETEY